MLVVGVGFLSAAATAAYAQDRIYKFCSLRYQDDGRPEYRLIITQLGMIVFPIGVLIWAWTAEAQTHWIGPVRSFPLCPSSYPCSCDGLQLIGSAIFAYGLMLAFNSIQVSLPPLISSLGLILALAELDSRRLLPLLRRSDGSSFDAPLHRWLSTPYLC